MILDINKIEEKALANFKGGEKALNARMHVDENNKIIFGRLEPGASIGEHTHETNSEIIFFTSGKGKVIYDGKEERVEAGLCHYCPQGHTHILINDSDADLTFHAVIPEHPDEDNFRKRRYQAQQCAGRSRCKKCFHQFRI